MFQAIQTKYHGPTNVKGARVSARAAAGRVILDWDHAKNPDQNHVAAALRCAQKFKWSGTWRGGVIKDGSYVFVSSRFPADKPDFSILA